MSAFYGGVPLNQPVSQVPALDRVGWANAFIRPREISELAQRYRAHIGEELWPLAVREQPLPDEIGELVWPQGASRFAVVHFIVSLNTLNQIRVLVHGGLAGTGYSALDLLLTDGVKDHQTPPRAPPYPQVKTKMFLLPPRPLQQIRDTNELYLITLVDERYFWSDTPADIPVPAPGAETTWASLYSVCTSALGISVFTGDPVNANYGFSFGNLAGYKRADAAVLFDAVAYTVGQRVVRNLDGSVAAQNFSTALDLLNINLDGISDGTCGVAHWTWDVPGGEGGPGSTLDWIAAGDNCTGGCIKRKPLTVGHFTGETRTTNCAKGNWRPVAGGHFWFPQGSDAVRPPDQDDRQGWLPEAVAVTWRQRANGKLTNVVGRGSALLSSFGAGPLTRFNTGSPNTKVVTALVEYDRNTDDVPTAWDTTFLTTFTRQWALDWYTWQLGTADIVYAGFAPWRMEGLTDTVRWSHRDYGLMTRAMRAPVNDPLDRVLPARGTTTTTTLAPCTGSCHFQWISGAWHRLPGQNCLPGCTCQPPDFCVPSGSTCLNLTVPCTRSGTGGGPIEPPLCNNTGGCVDLNGCIPACWSGTFICPDMPTVWGCCCGICKELGCLTPSAAQLLLGLGNWFATQAECVAHGCNSSGFTCSNVCTYCANADGTVTLVASGCTITTSDTTCSGSQCCCPTTPTSHTPPGFFTLPCVPCSSVTTTTTTGCPTAGYYCVQACPFFPSGGCVYYPCVPTDPPCSILGGPFPDAGSCAAFCAGVTTTTTTTPAPTTTTTTTTTPPPCGTCNYVCQSNGMGGGVWAFSTGACNAPCLCTPPAFPCTPVNFGNEFSSSCVPPV